MATANAAKNVAAALSPGDKDFAVSQRAIKFALNSQRLQELDEGFLIELFQFFKLLGDVVGLAAVASDGFEER